MKQATIPALPAGVVLTELEGYADNRGELFEIHREGTRGAGPLRQWNLSRCKGNSLRGVHLHLVHSDYLVVIEGDFVFGLRDMRPEEPTHGLAAMLELSGCVLRALLIPPGVAHGFFCATGGSIVYGLTHQWDPVDDLACRWDDPGHGMRFPASRPILSQRDMSAQSFADLAREYGRWCETHGGGSP